MNEEPNVSRSVNGHDLGTFNYLRVGWWVLHVVGIVAVAYLGYWYGTKMM